MMKWIKALGFMLVVAVVSSIGTALLGLPADLGFLVGTAIGMLAGMYAIDRWNLI